MVIKALFSLSQLWSTLAEVLPKRNILVIRVEAIGLNLNEKVLKIKKDERKRSELLLDKQQSTVLNILNICCLNKLNFNLKHNSVFLFLHA